MVGCNEVKYRDNMGKMAYKQIENQDLLDFNKSAYDKKQGAKDHERVLEIKQNFLKLKII